MASPSSPIGSFNSDVIFSNFERLKSRRGTILNDIFLYFLILQNIMKKRGIIFIILLILFASIVFASNRDSGREGSPPFDSEESRFSDSDLDSMIEIQRRNFEIVKNCRQTSFNPPDPDNRVSKIEVLGLVDSKCKLRIHTINGNAEYLLPEEVYTRVSDIGDLFKGECSGACGATEEASKAPEPVDKEERCMQSCIVRDCRQSELVCERLNRKKCEDECDIVRGPNLESMGKEERCITGCVNEVDPRIICGAGAKGETGNEVCQKCADKCSIYYEGPCLTDERWKEKEKGCLSKGRGWAAEDIRGDSGEGHRCVVDLKCVDYSYEFGDDPGSGPDSWKAGHEPDANKKYWWEYEATLELPESGDEGHLVIEGKEEVPFRIEEGVSTETKNNRIILKKDDKEIIVRDRSGELLSEHVNKIEEIDLILENEKAVYEIKTMEKIKLFGLIPLDMRITERIDADRLTLIEEDKPWWAFLAIEDEEYPKEIDEEFDITKPPKLSNDSYICKDTDGGIDYDQSGYVYKEISPQGGISQTIDAVPSDSDSCVSGNVLKEVYCEKNKEKSVEYECEDVCFENACDTIEISGVKVTDVTSDSVSVSWKTNIPTKSEVNYDKSDGLLGLLKIKSSILNENHKVKIIVGLESDSVYDFKVISCTDVFCKESEIKQFKTDCGTCFIDGVCYEDGEESPEGCLACNVEVSTDEWSNCKFDGTLHIVQSFKSHIDGIYKYGGYAVEGSAPDFNVSYFPDSFIQHKCYLEGKSTITNLFLADWKILQPEQNADVETVPGNISLYFECTGGGMLGNHDITPPEPNVAQMPS